jgi:hypothetical protein
MHPLALFRRYRCDKGVGIAGEEESDNTPGDEGPQGFSCRAVHICGVLQIAPVCGGAPTSPRRSSLLEWAWTETV